MPDLKKLNLADLFKIRDDLSELLHYGYWYLNTELSEVTEAIYEYQKKNMVEGENA